MKPPPLSQSAVAPPTHRTRFSAVKIHTHTLSGFQCDDCTLHTGASLHRPECRMTSKYSHALQTSQTCSFAEWRLMLLLKVAFEAPCACAHCGVKSAHDSVLPPCLNQCQKNLLFECFTWQHQRTVKKTHMYRYIDGMNQYTAYLLLGSHYLNATHDIKTLCPPDIAQCHAYIDDKALRFWLLLIQ